MLKIIDKNYVENFWVGLMDGDGSIQVNHWRKKTLQFRLIIKLKYTKSNHKMLNLISNNIRGSTKLIYTKKNELNIDFVIWVVNHKKKIIEICKIFTKHKPITNRLNAQLYFFYQNLEKNDINWYLLNRNLKYNNNNNNNNNNNVIHIINNNYFNIWLSGFIEAEGCFCIRKNNNHSFSIGQNNDEFIILFIKNYFNIENKIRKINNKFFSIEVYKKEILKKIILHCNTYPLLGEKAESLKKFEIYF
jgi:hypothetical protein